MKKIKFYIFIMSLFLITGCSLNEKKKVDFNQLYSLKMAKEENLDQSTVLINTDDKVLEWEKHFSSNPNVSYDSSLKDDEKNVNLKDIDIKNSHQTIIITGMNNKGDIEKIIFNKKDNNRLEDDQGNVYGP